MITKEQLTGVVLAGGQSSRFGSDKAMEKRKGKTFLEHAVEVLCILCTEVIISGSKEEYAILGHRLVKDKYETCGPLGGIHAALCSCHTEYALFLTCDMPLMETAPLCAMLGGTSTQVVGWKSGKEKGGIFPLLVSVHLIAEVEQALKAGNYSLRRSLCTEEHTRMIEIPDKWASFFTNVNRREDLNSISI